LVELSEQQSARAARRDRRSDTMKTESMAVLRWIPSALVAQGEEAVREHLEDALADAVGSNGYAPQGEIRVRRVEAEEYPQVTAAKPEDDEAAVLYLAEVEVG